MVALLSCVNYSSEMVINSEAYDEVDLSQLFLTTIESVLTSPTAYFSPAVSYNRC